MRCMQILAVLTSVVLLPAVVSAQATLAGTVKDASGAVLPGVTVEAASPALIEKVRSVITDGTGQYRIVDLRPGTYTATFTLPGFSTVKREGIELSGSFTATINVELTVGALDETITVTGEAPTVDVQSATRQRVMDAEVIAAIPTGRSYFDLTVLVPGVNFSSPVGGTGQDVGGSRGPAPAGLTAHGSHEDTQRITYNGVSLGTLVGSANRSVAIPNPSAYQEMTIDTGGATADQGQGGVRINFIPRDGGNSFKGSSFLTFATAAMQGDNFTQELRDRGLRTPNSIKRLWDINPGLGGPIMKDRLWFFGTLRHQRAENYIAGLFPNLNADNIAAWTYAPDLSRKAYNSVDWKDAQIRLTWQATPKNKFATSYNWQKRCYCFNGNATTSQEAHPALRKTPSRIATVEWSSPLSNRVLLEAVGLYHLEKLTDDPPPWNPLAISVTEQGGLIPGLIYRAGTTYNLTRNAVWYYRAAASYISGAHAVKVGFNDGRGWMQSTTYANQVVSYRFNNGVPNQLTQYAAPFGSRSEQDHDGGIYAQDRWSVGRLALTMGVRYDFYSNSFPEQHVGPSPLAPTRDFTFPRQDSLSWKDVTPKLAVAYNVFGDGKTALKASLNKYVSGYGLAGIATVANPAASLVTSTTRNWTDANGNFVAECNLLNPAANGECGGLANTNFGNAVVGTRIDPNLAKGWGLRGYDWEFTTGVQREVLPRVSVDVAYFRRWFGNFVTYDDRALAPSDFDQFSITAPVDARLPNGGGYTVSGLYDRKPATFGRPADLFVSLTDNYGKQIEHFNGLDLTVNARMQNGLVVQGGLSTGRTTKDDCETVANNPEFRNYSEPVGGAPSVGNFAVSAWRPVQFCHTQTPFLTQVKFLGSYTVPRIDVQMSATYQTLPGPSIIANYNAPNAVVAPSLGRPLAGNAPNIAVNIMDPAASYGDRLHQIDLRIGKLLPFGRMRNSISLDIFNALNSSVPTQENVNFAAFRVPLGILPARFMKVSWQLDF